MASRRGRAANNMGNISERADGRWQGRVSMPGGKRKYVYAHTEAECVDKVRAVQNDVSSGVYLPTKDQTLSTFLSDWLDNVIKPNRAPSTYNNYKQMINLYIEPAFGKIKLTKLTAQDIQRFENELRRRKVVRTGKPMSERTVELCHGILRAALNKAVKFSLIPRNPVLSVDPPQVRRKEVQPLTPAQARTLLENVRGTRLEAFFTVAVSLGVRPGEALGIRWRDVDWARSTVSIRQQLQRDHDGKLVLSNLKTERSRRVIHLPSVTLRALKEHLAKQKEVQMRSWQWEDNDFLFCTDGARRGNVGGRPLLERNVFRALQVDLERAGLPHQSLYSLRHLAASLLAAQGASMLEIMGVLGHSQMSLTSDTYSHLYDDSRKASADRMDRALMSDHNAG